jgi:hypothetical protein
MKKLALMMCAFFIAAAAFALVPAKASANYSGGYPTGYGGKMVYKTAYKKPVKKTSYYGRGGYNRYQAMNHAHINAYNTTAGVGGYHYYNYEAQPNGKILVTWDRRGDTTCHIAYTESGGNAYQYKTQAECRDGALVIAGLVPGMEYKFAVHAENSPVWYGEQPEAHAVALY